MIEKIESNETKVAICIKAANADSGVKVGVLIDGKVAAPEQTYQVGAVDAAEIVASGRAEYVKKAV